MAAKKMSFRGVAVTIACTDLSQSRHFYATVLGAEPDPRESGCPWYRLGSMRITLMPNASEPSPATFPAHAMPILWLEVDDLEVAYRRVQRHDVEVLDYHEGQFMLIADPDGLVIEVWQADQPES